MPYPSKNPSTYSDTNKNSAAFTLPSRSLDYDYLLLQDGFFLLLQDSGKIILVDGVYNGFITEPKS